MDGTPNGIWDFLAGNDTSATFWENPGRQFLIGCDFPQLNHYWRKMSKYVTILLFIKDVAGVQYIIPTHKKIYTHTDFTTSPIAAFFILNWPVQKCRRLNIALQVIHYSEDQIWNWEWFGKEKKERESNNYNSQISPKTHDKRNQLKESHWVNKR